MYGESKHELFNQYKTNTTGHVHIKVTLRRVRVTTIVVVYLYLHILFVASVIQHEIRMRHIILPSVTCLAVPHFFRN
jgi:hypothetical protein